MYIFGYSLVSWLFAILVCLFLSYYIYAKSKLQFFKKQNVAGPEPNIIFGNLWGCWKKTMSEIQTENRKKYGKVFGTFEGLNPNFSIADPEILRNIFVKDFHKFINRRANPAIMDGFVRKFLTVVEDEEWKGIRSLVSPAFSTGKLKKMTKLMCDCGETLVKHFKEKQDSRGIDVRELFRCYTFDVIGNCAFGTKIDSLGQKDDPFVKAGRKITQESISDSPAILLFVFFPQILKYLSVFIKTFQEVMQFFQSVIDKILKDRDYKASNRGDFLDLMLDEVNKAKNADANSEMAEKTKYATYEVLMAQAVLFFLAGFDTTSTTLTWLSYHLATNPEIQEKVFKELQTKVKEHGGFNSECLNELHYLDMVINESARITPAAAMLERRCSETVTYGNITIEKDMMVTIPVYSIHHDQEYYPQPDKFIPERFSPEGKAERNPYTFLPFGQGPRACVGMRFAMDETKVAIAHLVYNFKLVPTEQTQVPTPVCKGPGFLAPKDLKLGVVPR